MKANRARNHRAPSDRDRSLCGYSLIEVVISLGILAFGVLGVTTGQIMAMKSGTASRDQTLAMYLCDQAVETLQEMPIADVVALITAPGYPNDPNNPIDPDPHSRSSEFDRRWTIQPDTPEVGVTRITVEVDWVNSLGITRTVSLETMKAGS